MLATGRALPEIGQSHHIGRLNLMLLALGVRTKVNRLPAPGSSISTFAARPSRQIEFKEAPDLSCTVVWGTPPGKAVRHVKCSHLRLILGVI